MTKFTVVPQDPTPNYEEQSVSRLMSPPNAADSPHTSHWDPNSFIYPATDDRGAFEKVDVRMTPELRHQMLAIVAAQRFPYMSEKDYMRHALVRHAQWLHTLDHTIPYYLPSIEVIAQIERERVKRE